MNNKTKPPPGTFMNEGVGCYAVIIKPGYRCETEREALDAAWAYHDAIRAAAIADALRVLDEMLPGHLSEYFLRQARDRIAALASAAEPESTNNNNERFFYLRKFNKQPIGVMFLRKENATQVRIAASLCAPTDRWNRDLGILRAKSRLDSEKQSLVVGLVDKQYFFLVEDEVLHIDKIFERLMPRKSMYNPLVINEYGVQTGSASTKLKHQMERMLGVKK
jgi:plasmid stabilization system protein ParE